ncbi:hypothetical protein C369_06387 [Cryptococcus neoformans A5-35-17]|nr:hypothetical protein C369_06387 [Cryptococcus neoformans var. grubii A5-35-17]
MPLKITKGAMEDSPPESSTAVLLECLVGHAQKQDDTLALLTELLLKQQKRQRLKIGTILGVFLYPRPQIFPVFRVPWGMQTALLTPSDDEELEARRRITVIELANNSIDCAGLVGWVEHEGHCMEEDGKSTWQTGQLHSKLRPCLHTGSIGSPIPYSVSHFQRFLPMLGENSMMLLFFIAAIFTVPTTIPSITKLPAFTMLLVPSAFFSD